MVVLVCFIEYISWLVLERILNRGNEPLLHPKNGKYSFPSVYCVVCFIMGLPWFRQGEIIETATREMTDVISIKHVNANDEQFALAA